VLIRGYFLSVASNYQHKKTQLAIHWDNQLGLIFLVPFVELRETLTNFLQFIAGFASTSDI
jgi:hypothetical protein